MRKGRGRKNAQELAEEVVAEATGPAETAAGDSGQARGRKRKRQATPEGAEAFELVPAEIKMADLVKDRCVGKRSQREAEMEKVDWAEVKRRRRVADKEAMREERKHNASKRNALPAPGPQATERLVLVNGQMVVDDSSRVIDRSAATVRDADQHGEAIDEDRLTARVNQATVGRKAGTRVYSSWDDDETERFYDGLRMFGTDFMMISKIFPDTTRAVVKKKFNQEEKYNPDKVLTALNSKVSVDLKTLSEITNTTYGDPNEFYKELEEEQARMEAANSTMPPEEEQADQAIQQSIEQQEEVDAPEGTHVQADQSHNENRFAEEARNIIDGAAVPRRKKAKKTPSAKKKDGKKSHGPPAEGTEEIVGTIENFDP